MFVGGHPAFGARQLEEPALASDQVVVAVEGKEVPRLVPNEQVAAGEERKVSDGKWRYLFDSDSLRSRPSGLAKDSTAPQAV